MEGKGIVFPSSKGRIPQENKRMESQFCFLGVKMENVRITNNNNNKTTKLCHN